MAAESGISGSDIISEGIHLLKKETNFEEWDVHVIKINCIIFSKMLMMDPVDWGENKIKK